MAVKEMIPALVGDEAMLTRILAEPGATKRLTHKPVVRTHTVLSEASNHCIVKEHMPGGLLWGWLRRRGCLPVEDAIRIAAAVCKGLDYAHKRGLVHCDLKPADILKPFGQSSYSVSYRTHKGWANVSDRALNASVGDPWRTGNADSAAWLQEPIRLEGLVV